MTQAFPLIEISGAPRERGRQYGRQAAERIVKGVSYYSAQIQKLGLDQPKLAAVIRDYLPVMEGFDAAHVEEMRGIAEGAGIPFEDVVLFNARSEVLKRAASPAPCGWRSPSGQKTGVTLPVLHELGYEYDSSAQDDDKPYVMGQGDGPTLVELPVFDYLNDSNFFAQRHSDARVAALMFLRLKKQRLLWGAVVHCGDDQRNWKGFHQLLSSLKPSVLNLLLGKFLSSTRSVSSLSCFISSLS